MIDNIKRIINEHHTLMVVIIGVLVIYFIYWWFYCKDRPSANKVKGGVIKGLIFPLRCSLSKHFYNVECVCVRIFRNNENKYGLFVPSRKGESNILNDSTIFEKFQKYYDNLLNNRKLSTRQIIERPYTVFNVNGRITTIQNWDNYINLCANTHEFDFDNFLKKVDVGTEIQNCYNELCEFMVENCYEYIDFVEILGQPSYCARVDFDTSDETVLNDLKKYDDSVRWSPSKKGGIENSMSYELLKKKIRNWYNDDMSSEFIKCFVSSDGSIEQDDIKKVKPDNIKLKDNNELQLLSQLMVMELIDEDNTTPTQQPRRNASRAAKNVVRDDDYDFDDYDNSTYIQKTGFYEIPKQQVNTTQKKSESNSTWQVADVYPAYKVLMCFFMMLMYLPNYVYHQKYMSKSDATNRYLKMIASYMIQVHLLNSFCSIKMDNSWNSKIGNTYVYKIKSLNELPFKSKKFLMNINNEMLEQLSGYEIGKDIEEGNIQLRIEGFLEALGDEATKILYSKLITNESFLDKLRNLQKKCELTNEILQQAFNESLDEMREKSQQSSQLKNENKLSKFHDIMVNVESLLIAYFDNVESVEEDYQNIINSINDDKINEDKYSLKMFLYIINSISLNHIRKNDFIAKAEQILLFIKNDVINKLGVDEILQIFEKNKRILLFLFNEQFIDFNIIPDKNLMRMFRTSDFIKYFFQELQSTGLIDKLNIKSQVIEYKIEDSYCEFRGYGENPHKICCLIRNDSVNDFKQYISANNISINAIIEDSEFETNSMLLENPDIRLIEYAAFHGSVEIFKFLFAQEDIKIFDKLLYFAIHGNCAEIIHKLKEKTHLEYDCKHLEIAIKCHANDVANYILSKIVIFDDITICVYGIENYNFSFISLDSLSDLTFFKRLCFYDYYQCVHCFLNSKHIDNGYISKQINQFSPDTNGTLAFLFESIQTS